MFAIAMEVICMTVKTDIQLIEECDSLAQKRMRVVVI